MIAQNKVTTNTTLTLSYDELDDLTHAVSKAVFHMKKERLTCSAGFASELLDVLVAAQDEAKIVGADK